MQPTLIETDSKNAAPAAPPANSRSRLAGIDGLRGLAALWVALSHYVPHWNQRGGHAFEPVPNLWGIYAVELFFVISGFVIFMTLEKCRGLADFAVLRFSRLYPAYWATMALAAIAGALFFAEPVWPLGLAMNATMFHEFLGFKHFDNVYWSLTAELAFYLNAAWLFALGWHRRPLRVAAVWLALSAAWALWLRDPSAPAHTRDAWSLWLVLDHAPYFAMGLAFYDALRRGWTPQRGALIAAAIACESLIDGRAGFIVASAIAGLFALAVSGRARFLASRPLLALGAISYGFYLIHRNLGYRSLDWMQARGWPVWAAVAAAVAGAILLATAVHLIVEKPALAGLRKAWRAKAAP